MIQWTKNTRLESSEDKKETLCCFQPGKMAEQNVALFHILKNEK